MATVLYYNSNTTSPMQFFLRISAYAIFVLTTVEAIVTGGNPNDVKYLIENDEAPFFVSLFSRGDCAGTIIANNYVLTAAHCIDSPPKTILYNNESYNPWAAFLNPNCLFSMEDDGPNRCDVAVLAFEEDLLASGASYLPIYSSSDENGKTIKIYGYGVTGDAGNLTNSRKCSRAEEDGKFRRAENIVTSVTDGVVRYRMDEDGLSLEGMAQDGDSGGPATITIDGIEYLAGANSGTSERNSCDYGSIDEYSRLSEHYDFIALILDPNNQSICPWVVWKQPTLSYNSTCIPVGGGTKPSFQFFVSALFVLIPGLLM